MIENSSDRWQRVSPKYLVVEIVGALIPGLIVCAASTVALVAGWPLGWWPWIVLVVTAVWTVLYLALTPRRVRSIGYQLRDDDLLFRRGVMIQRIVAIPYGRMQLIDMGRGPLDRWLGLADLKFVTAAAATAVSIPGLPVERAEELRERLVALAETRRAGL